MMLHLYNTLTRKKEEFKPLTDGKVGMYACGVTVYDYCHLGNARAMVNFDVLHRYLKYVGYDVTFVRNFTDVDDKIIRKANAENISCSEVTSKYIAAFYEDTNALGLVNPTIEPRATDHIPDIIAIINKLVDKGLAYQIGGDVFYAVRSFPQYGKLSGKNIEDLESGARVDVSDVKKDPLDFALWKSAKPNEPKWPSPWGEGRPGWHIECSAMSTKYLGDTFDIHCGGCDLIFPHHENEIAQSEGATGKPFARFWVHNGFLNIDSEKMSKSLGNFFTTREVLKKFPAEAIRHFILSAHYRSPIDYSEKNISDSIKALERFYQTKSRLEKFIQQPSDPAIPSQQHVPAKLENLKNEFIMALDDDLNTAMVMGLVFEWVRTWNKLIDENRANQKDAKDFLDIINDIHKVLGVFGSDANAYLDELKQKGMAGLLVLEEDILKLIEERKLARKNRDFKRSDEIRDQLLKQGITLKDNTDGTTSWMVNKL
ncbi:MAG TPA: cysteine--tRNA ligase [bacterium]|nr:cysteine--tRNA ligase [bacterium]